MKKTMSSEEIPNFVEAAGAAEANLVDLFEYRFIGLRGNNYVFVRRAKRQGM